MIIRLTLKESGKKTNLVASSIVGFSEEEDRTSKVSLINGSVVHVEDSAQTIRGAFKRLAAPAAASEAEAA